MPSYVFFLLMCGAALHATWNALIRGAGDRIITTIAVSGGAALVAACVLPFLVQPQVASWPFLVVSMVIHIVSYMLTARAYHEADMTQVYPLMRGAAPLLTALVAIVWLHDPVPPFAWVGMAIISFGVGSLVLARHHGWSGRGLAYALANALAIAFYSATDGAGVRLSHAPAGYALWVFLLTGVALLGWNVANRGRLFAKRLAQSFWRGVFGGAGSALSYGIALWAITRVPIAVVSAARECSIAFGTLIAILFLGERVSPRRVIATGCIVAGAVVLRLA
ncbi:SMR family transporter [Nguyenibacter vanlangensis]|uniref:SMR family transporter n=1 Tax=Nguyenibacter vanlangensis TaxID=1216886 RepID=A0ABZ3D9E7_9PROT